MCISARSRVSIERTGSRMALCACRRHNMTQPPRSGRCTSNKSCCGLEASMVCGRLTLGPDGNPAGAQARR